MKLNMHNLGTGLKRIDAISEFAGMIARWAVPVMVAAIVTEVALRYILNSPTVWAHPLSQMLWAFYILLGGSYVLRLNAHVNMDLLYRRVSPRKRAIIDLFTHLLFFVFIIAILVHAVPFAWESLMRLEHYSGKWTPPKWPIKMLVPTAVLLLLLQGIAKYIRDLHMAFTGRELE